MDDMAMTADFDEAMAEIEKEGFQQPLGDEVEQFLDEQQRTVLRAEQRMVHARRRGNSTLSAIAAEKKRIEAEFLAASTRLNEAEAKARADMQREIATAQKLAAAGRAALQAVQP
ncbi:MAG: hypothetical protein M9955_17130 [Rhizobiaceae bacterium]|nr:hypothetical protein [Rhizobiaceae bacterium]